MTYDLHTANIVAQRGIKLLFCNAILVHVLNCSVPSAKPICVEVDCATVLISWLHSAVCLMTDSQNLIYLHFLQCGTFAADVGVCHGSIMFYDK